MATNSEDRIVTIFGGSKCNEDSEEYKQAKDLGALLADAGFTICTGGYPALWKLPQEEHAKRADECLVL